MKKNIITLLLILSTVAVVSAKSTLRSSYFVEQSTMRHKLNTAFIGERGYFSIPMLGDVGMSINTPFALQDLLTPLDNGDLGLFLHPDVDAQPFIDGLKDDNYFSESFNMSILSTGFNSFGGYTTIDLSLHETMNMNIKKSFFDFLAGTKSGDTSIYDAAGTNFDLNSYAEIAVGHAHKISERLTIGVKYKYYVGLVSSSLELTKAKLSMTDDAIDMQLQLNGDAAVMGTPINGPLSDIEIGDVDFKDGPKGRGMAFDFGAVYEMDRFTFSASFNDLGYLKWNKPSIVSSTLDTQFTGFNDIDIEDFNSSTDDQMDDIQADFDAFTEAEFKPGESYKSKLTSTINLAAEYDIFEDKLSAGVLYTKTMGAVSTSETTLALNYNLAKWLTLVLTGTKSTYGTYWGWMFNLSPGFINIYLGCDSMVTKLTPQYMPYKSGNVSFNFGMSVPMGARR